jgi:magnesium-transporting ATPase (P-type)
MSGAHVVPSFVRYALLNPALLFSVQQVDVVVFDKTGTLTSGKPVVTAVAPLTGGGGDKGVTGGTPMSTDQILTLAAAVEGSTTHPVAQVGGKYGLSCASCHFPQC